MDEFENIDDDFICHESLPKISNLEYGEYFSRAAAVIDGLRTVKKISNRAAYILRSHGRFQGRISGESILRALTEGENRVELAQRAESVVSSQTAIVRYNVSLDLKALQAKLVALGGEDKEEVTKAGDLDGTCSEHPHDESAHGQTTKSSSSTSARDSTGTISGQSINSFFTENFNLDAYGETHWSRRMLAQMFDLPKKRDYERVKQLHKRQVQSAEDAVAVLDRMERDAAALVRLISWIEADWEEVVELTS
ncbi:hypothetical protein SCAR479_02198 [Seiridium cardinale]|uniref:Uncharacterized protein n=1 Tax=Seiridium cardinale TaxID=138064 RepID=A0ABR2X597_9PEZI